MVSVQLEVLACNERRRTGQSQIASIINVRSLQAAATSFTAASSSLLSTSGIQASSGIASTFGSASWRNSTFSWLPALQHEIPDTVQAAADNGCNTARHGLQLAKDRSAWLYQSLFHIYKQLNSQSPVSSMSGQKARFGFSGNTTQSNLKDKEPSGCQTD